MIENARDVVLFGRSTIRRAILAMLFDAPERRIHLRAVARAVGTSAGTAARELGRLEDAGILRRTREGHQVYFQARQDQPKFAELRELVRETIGAPIVVRRRLAGLVGVERAVIFGSYARGTVDADSDVDVLIIGNPDRDDLTERLESAGLEIGRPVNEVVMASSELEERRARGDRFIGSIDTGPLIDVSPPIVASPAGHWLAEMEHADRITLKAGKRGGQPTIRGLRITVYDILGYLAAGMTESEIVRDFPDLEIADIRAALAYAADREWTLRRVSP